YAALHRSHRRARAHLCQAGTVTPLARAISAGRAAARSRASLQLGAGGGALPAGPCAPELPRLGRLGLVSGLPAVAAGCARVLEVRDWRCFGARHSGTEVRVDA